MYIIIIITTNQTHSNTNHVTTSQTNNNSQQVHGLQTSQYSYQPARSTTIHSKYMACRPVSTAINQPDPQQFTPSTWLVDQSVQQQQLTPSTWPTDQWVQITTSQIHTKYMASCEVLCVHSPLSTTTSCEVLCVHGPLGTSTTTSCEVQRDTAYSRSLASISSSLSPVSNLW